MKAHYLTKVGEERNGGYDTLERAHAEYPLFSHQQTFEDIENLPADKYLHIMELRDGEHYNDLYFTKTEFI